MRARSQILRQLDVPSNRRAVRALKQLDIAKAMWHAGYTLERFADIEKERSEIRRIVRRYNRRFRRMSGQSLKGC